MSPRMQTASRGQILPESFQKGTQPCPHLNYSSDPFALLTSRTIRLKKKKITLFKQVSVWLFVIAANKKVIYCLRITSMSQSHTT